MRRIPHAEAAGIMRSAQLEPLDCRFTFASTLLSAGVSVKAVADWLGHASAAITLTTYGHLMPVDDDRARQVLDSAFNSAGDLLGTGTDGATTNHQVRGVNG